MQAVIERNSSPARFTMTLAAALLLGGAGGYIVGTSVAAHATHPGACPTVVEPAQRLGHDNPSTISGPTEADRFRGLMP